MVHSSFIRVLAIAGRHHTCMRSSSVSLPWRREFGISSAYTNTVFGKDQCTEVGEIKDTCKANDVLNSLSKRGRLREAMQVLDLVDNPRVRIHRKTYSALLQVCTKVKNLGDVGDDVKLIAQWHVTLRTNWDALAPNDPRRNQGPFCVEYLAIKNANCVALVEYHGDRSPLLDKSPSQERQNPRRQSSGSGSGSGSASAESRRSSHGGRPRRSSGPI